MNHQFAKISNTVMSSQAILNVNKNAGLATIFEVEGSVSPTTASTPNSYALLKPDGTPVVLPQGALITGVSLSAFSTPLVTAGAQTLQTVLSLTQGGAVYLPVHVASTVANVNTGVIPLVNAMTGGEGQYVGLITTGATFTSGTVRAKVQYV